MWISEFKTHVGPMLRWSVRVAATLLMANVAASVLLRDYLVQTSAFRFPASTPFKPLLLLNGALILHWLFKNDAPHQTCQSRDVTGFRRLPFAFALTVAVMLLYVPSIQVNLQHHDWTHRHIAAALHANHDVLGLFTRPQPDGMYRPLTFLSFWLDYALFGDMLWGYHIQSICLHVLNAHLVSALALRLGFSMFTAQGAAALFAVASVNFEAVLWPAARFDLLAASFSLVSLILFLQHWAARRLISVPGILSIVSFVIAVLNKESAYSVVPIVGFLLLSRRLRDRKISLGSIESGFFVCLVFSAAVLLAVRLWIYGGIGGYSGEGGESIHSVITAKTAYSWIVNTLALPLFSINTTGPALAMGILVIAYACWAIVTLWSTRRISPTSQVSVMLVFALLSSIPIANVIGWIQPSLQHSRLLYWPSVWMAIFMVGALRFTRNPRVTLAALILLQAAGVTYNIWIYRDMVARCHVIAQGIEYDVRESSSPAQSSRIVLQGVPGTPNGVFYFADELRTAIEAALPQSSVLLCGTPDACHTDDYSAFHYRWDNQRHTLVWKSTPLIQKLR